MDDAEGRPPWPRQRIAAQRSQAAATIRAALRMPSIDLGRAFGRLVGLAEVDESDEDFELGLAIEVTLPRLTPAEREAFVVRGLRSHNTKLRGLAQCQVVATPPVESAQVVFEEWWSDPRLRPALFAEPRLGVAFCPFLRRRLRAGKLSLDEASATMEAIGELWGGIDDGSTEEDRLATGEGFASWHEGAEEIGPPTCEEWEVCRSLQNRAARLGTHNVAQLLRVRPARGLHGNDLALIERFTAQWRELPGTLDDAMSPRVDATIVLLLALARVRDPAVLPHVRELANDGPEPFASLFRDLVARLEDELARRAN